MSNKRAFEGAFGYAGAEVTIGDFSTPQVCPQRLLNAPDG